jgi:hypothetical protein
MSTLNLLHELLNGDAGHAGRVGHGRFMCTHETSILGFKEKWNISSPDEIYIFGCWLFSSFRTRYPYEYMQIVLSLMESKLHIWKMYNKWLYFGLEQYHKRQGHGQGGNYYDDNDPIYQVRVDTDACMDSYISHDFQIFNSGTETRQASLVHG